MALRALALTFLFAVSAQLAQAQGVAAQEHEVKAAFLFRFLSFIDWPAEAFPQPTTPVSIGVLGGDEVAAELRRVVPGRTVNGRQVAVRTLRPGEAPGGLHMLFVGRSESARIPQLSRQAGPGLLIVSEAEGALDQGSVVNFVVTEGRVRFEVALDAAERQRLRVSSRMLSVAHLVRPGTLRQ